MTLDAAAARRLRKEQAQLTGLWDFVAQTFAKRPFLSFAFWLHEEQSAVALAGALTKAGLQSEAPLPGRRWLRRGWWVRAVAKLGPAPTQTAVNALLENVVTIGAEYGGAFMGWGATERPPVLPSSAA